MHPAYVMYLPGLHPEAVCRDDPPEFGQWYIRSVFSDQPYRPQSAATVASVAANIQDQEAIRDLA